MSGAAGQSANQIISQQIQMLKKATNKRYNSTKKGRESEKPTKNRSALN